MQAIILHNLGFGWRTAFIDSGIANILLAGAVFLVTISLQHYLPQKNRYSYLLALCFVLSLLWLFISRTVTIALIKENGYAAFYSQSLWIRGAMGFLVVGCMALISTLWYTLQDQRDVEKRKEEADRLSRAAELNSLRQQLQPHFLFNSLNSINALIQVQPEKARQMVQQLSDFLRGTLRDQQQWVSLDKELDHLQLYLDIEKVRFGHRLSAEIRNEAPGTQLPAMLLQPLVENAIKFGLYDTIDDITIRINARKDDGALVVQVSNPFDGTGDDEQKGVGFGLSSVQRRLHLLFARNDLLTTEKQDNRFITTVKIPQP